jgi:hypothetical protein
MDVDRVVSMKCGQLVIAILGVALTSRGAGQEQLADIVRSSDGQLYSASAYRAGREEATKDIRANHLILESFGSAAPWDADYARILEQKYHIQLRAAVACDGHDQCFGHAKGYNRVVKVEIRRRFGSDVLKAAWDEAKQLHEASSR